MRSLSVVALLLMGWAAAGTPAAAAPASIENVKKGTYAFDPDHTQVGFDIMHMGLSTFFGRFGKVTGTANFDPDAPQASTIDAVIDMTDIDTHVAALDGILKRLFKADKFPTAQFRSTAIAATGANTGTVTGDLTIAGVTKSITLDVVFNGGRNSPIPFQPYRIGFDAKGTIKRSDFGLDNTIWSGLVSDEVGLRIEAEGELQ